MFDRESSDDQITCSGDPAGSKTPRTSPEVGSSGSVNRVRLNRENLAGDGRHAAYRRGVPIEVDAIDPTLERNSANDRRRFFLTMRQKCFRSDASNSCRSLHARRSAATTFSGLTVGGGGRELLGRSLRHSCPQGQPHPRLLRPVCVWAEETGRAYRITESMRRLCRWPG